LPHWQTHEVNRQTGQATDAVAAVVLVAAAEMPLFRTETAF
jgi:hypothetical protein